MLEKITMNKASMYAATGMSVSSGYKGLPAHPRSPLNFRPLMVNVGLDRGQASPSASSQCRRAATE